MSYTLGVLVAVGVAVLLDLAVLRTRLLTRRAFWVAYAIVLFCQLIVNGLLTGLGIVRYNPAKIIGWRLAWAPVEDLLFGLAMVTLTLSLWVWAGCRARCAAGPTSQPSRVPGSR